MERSVRFLRDITVLLDGWALAYDANGSAAVSLHTLLDYLPEDIRLVVALAAKPVDLLPERVMAQVIDTPLTMWARLTWEQHTLNRTAKKVAADFVHLTSGAPALFGTGISVVSPAGEGFQGVFTNQDARLQSPVRQRGLSERLRIALLHGGLLRSSAIIWPTDLPEPKVGIPLFKLPPIIPKIFWDENQFSIDLAGVELPENYILCQGTNAESDLRMLLDAWRWASTTLGETMSLVTVGLDLEARLQLVKLSADYQLTGTVLALPEVPLAKLAVVFRRCTALLQINPISPWGDPIRLALASGKPVVGLENPLSDALVGPAAYLVRPGESAKATARALGAALVTVIGEESVAEPLADEAKKRSAAWKVAESLFGDELSFAYLNLLHR